MTWDERIFWPAFEQAGMLVDATVGMTGCPQERAVKVLLTRPDVQLVDGALARYAGSRLGRGNRGRCATAETAGGRRRDGSAASPSNERR